MPLPISQFHMYVLKTHNNNNTHIQHKVLTERKTIYAAYIFLFSHVCINTQSSTELQEVSTIYNCIQTIPQPHIFTFFKAFNFSGQHFFFVRIPGKEKRTPRVHVLVFTKHLFSLASFFSLDKMKTE